MKKRIISKVPYILAPIIFILAIAVFIVLKGNAENADYKQDIKSWDSVSALSEMTAMEIFEEKKAKIDEYTIVRDEELQRLWEEKYDAMFVSSIDVTDWDISPLIINGGLQTIAFSTVIPSLSELELFMDNAYHANPHMKKIFIYADPWQFKNKYNEYEQYEIGFDELFYKAVRKYAEEYKNIEMNILLPVYSVEYWAAIDEDAIDERFNEWTSWISSLNKCDNVKFYCAGLEEWVLSNPSNFNETGLLTSSCSNVICHRTFCDGDEIIVEGNAGFFKDNLLNSRNKFISGEYTYDFPDNLTVLILGDTQIALNSKNVYSVNNVVESMAGVWCYNLAEEGQRVVETDNFDLIDTVDLLTTSSLPPLTSKKYKKYLEFYNSYTVDTDLWIFIDCGVIDYYNSSTLISKDKSDLSVFENALSKAVRELKKAYPDSHIVLIGPFGATEPTEAGSLNMWLYNYIAVEKRVAKNENTLFFNLNDVLNSETDCYNTLVYNGVMLTEKGDFYIAEKLLKYIEENK